MESYLFSWLCTEEHWIVKNTCSTCVWQAGNVYKKSDFTVNIPNIVSNNTLSNKEPAKPFNLLNDAICFFFLNLVITLLWFLTCNWQCPVLEAQLIATVNMPNVIPSKKKLWWNIKLFIHTLNIWRFLFFLYLCALHLIYICMLYCNCYYNWMWKYIINYNM